MRKIGMAAMAVLIMLLLFGCGADETASSEGGSKAKVTPLVKDNAGNWRGPEAVKTLDVNITTVEKGASDGKNEMYYDHERRSEK